MITVKFEAIKKRAFSMKSFFSGVLGWIVIAIAAVCIAAFIAWSRAPDILANNLSKKLGVPVEIEDISLGFSHITVENFEIGNVPNGILPKAFSVETLAVNAPLGRYLNDQIVIDTIKLDNVYLGLEFDSATSTNGNWTRIMSNLQDSTDTDQNVPPSERSRKRKSQQQAPANTPKTGKSLLIKELIINNISVDLVYVKGDGKIKKLPMIKQIVLRNISSEEGFPMDQLMNSVLGQMLQQVFIQQNLKNMIQELVPKAQDLNNLLDPFKGLLKP